MRSICSSEMSSVGEGGIASPLSEKSQLTGFGLVRTEYFGEDVLYVYRKDQN